MVGLLYLFSLILLPVGLGSFCLGVSWRLVWIWCACVFCCLLRLVGFSLVCRGAGFAIGLGFVVWLVSVVLRIGIP